VCLATADAAAAPVFGLRMSHIGLTAPAALTTGAVQSIFEQSTVLNLPACGLGGGGLFNWLLRFDGSGALTTGAAAPVANPASGYSFLGGAITLGGVSFDVSPGTLQAPFGPTCDIESTAVDVNLPFYGDASGTLMTLFPLHALRFSSTTITPDHNCIGSYNTAGLSPASQCQPDASHPQWIDGGNFAAFIVLEEADTVLVPELNETLCLLIAGGPSMQGTLGGTTMQACARGENNAIAAQGDWCSTTDAPASAGCADAMRFAGSFAASGTAIH
jgi:hypothetical protein